jgi:futalosine hydrolase
MKILLIAATQPEIAPFCKKLNFLEDKVNIHGDFELKVLITGAGMVATTYQLSRVLQHFHPDLLLNVGIAGSIDPDLKRTTLTNVVSDHFYGFGAEHGDYYISASDIGLQDKRFDKLESIPFPAFFSKLIERINILPHVKGITVQTVHGEEQSILKLRRLNPEAQIESMEGAAVMYIGLQEQIPVVQLRSISNPVEPRNREGWDIEGSIAVLNDFLYQLFKS